MHTTPKDAPLTLTFDQAAKHASKLDEHGHKDWRVPTKAELNVLFRNRAAIGGFDTTGSDPAGWYWVIFARWQQTRGSSASQHSNYRDGASALRCVRE
jgi:hypothetical protein